MSSTASRSHLTLWTTVKELGWFPFVLMGIGGLSVIGVLEGVIGRHLDLTTPFEFLMSGYRRVAQLIGDVVEPPVSVLLDWIDGLVGLRLKVHDYWRSLFILVMVPLIANFRTGWTATEWRKTVLWSLILTAVLLCLTLVVGLGGIELFSSGLATSITTIFAFAVVVFAIGTSWIREGLELSDERTARRGLATVGGFAAAGLMLLADALVKAVTQ